MQTLRIFISSPGDVAEERDRARQVVESLRRRYVGSFFLKPVIWEDLPLQADMSFQQGIDLVLSKEHGVDIAVFILWSRLGSPLGALIRKPDGTEYRSGTERELDLMITARQQTGGTRPALMVYTRRDETSFDERLRGKPTQEKEDIIAQKKLVEQFIAEEFRDGGSGHNVRAYHSFDRPVTFSQRLRTHLTDLLDELSGGSVTESVWDIEKQGPPFLGLEAFQPQHADVFFGRETETLEARHALREQARNGCAFLLLSGASGSGKSSFARAGVLPAIVENELDEQVTAWRTLIASPLELGTDPLAGLIRRLAGDDGLPDLRGDTGALDDLIEGMRRDPVLTYSLRVKDAFARAAKRAGGGVRMLLVLDQLEELFATAAASDTARQEFLEAVEAMARSGHVWVLATVRSDFWTQVQAQPALVRMTEGHGLLPVLPPETDSLRRLIEEPARLAGLTFEQREGQSLADRILRDAAAHAELLPLLEYVLRELFEQRTAERVLTLETYEKLGGVEGALAKRAEDVFKSLPSDAQESLGSVLKALVTVGQEGIDSSTDQIVRQRVPHASLTIKVGAATLVQAFVQERLLTTANDPATGEAVVTVAHESLMRVWPRAISWAEHNRDFLHTRARIAARMKERSPLLDGDPLLDAAKAHLLTNADGFSQEQRQYVERSIQEMEKTKNNHEKKRRLIVSVLAGLATISLLAGITAYLLKNRADAEAEKTRMALTESQRQSERAEHEAEVAMGMQRIAIQEMKLARQNKESADKALRNALASSLWGRLSADLQSGRVNPGLSKILWSLRWGNSEHINIILPLLLSYNAQMGYENPAVKRRKSELRAGRLLVHLIDSVCVVDNFLQRKASYTMRELDILGPIGPFLWDKDTKVFMARMLDAMADPSPADPLERWTYGDKVAFAKYRDLTRCAFGEDIEAMERLVKAPYFWHDRGDKDKTTPEAPLGTGTYDSFLRIWVGLVVYFGEHQKPEKPDELLSEQSPLARDHLPPALTSFHWFARNLSKWGLTARNAPLKDRVKALDTEVILGLRKLNVGSIEYAKVNYPTIHLNFPAYQWELMDEEPLKGNPAEREKVYLTLESQYPGDFSTAYALLKLARSRQDKAQSSARAAKLTHDWDLDELVRVHASALCSGLVENPFDFEYFMDAATTSHSALGTANKWGQTCDAIASDAEALQDGRAPTKGGSLALLRLAMESLSAEYSNNANHRVGAERFANAEERLAVAIKAGFLSDAEDYSSYTGQMSWYALFANRPENAVKWADASLAKKAGNMVGLTNRAHGLLLTGKLEEALQLYEKPASMDLTEWVSVLADDFAQLKAAGMERPEMDQVLTRLKAGTSPQPK